MVISFDIIGVKPSDVVRIIIEHVPVEFGVIEMSKTIEIELKMHLGYL